MKRPGPGSDVTRFRGVFAAAAAGAALAGGLAAWAAGPGAPAGAGSPGPLSRPHLRAGLTCESCHEADPPGRACRGCHGESRAPRPAHRPLAAAGAMTCADCHRVHRSAGGVVLREEGAVRFGPGAEEPIDPPLRFHRAGGGEVTVAIVEAAACARCHQPGDASDPIAACLIAGQGPLGASRPTVCFDEHAASGTSSRAAAWEVAREAAARAPLAPSARGGAGGPLTWIGFGALAAFAVFGGVRGVDARRSRRRDREPVGESAPALRPPEERRLPIIDASRCIACDACVEACPLDVLELKDFVATVARPADCCGLTLCEQRCPTQALVMGEGEPNPDMIAVRESLESREVPGLYLAGDVTGLPLIKNAINQGALAVRALADDLAAAGRRRGAERDLIIVGAGPAGISAALEAEARGLSYLVLEQGTVAGSIQSFPRGKLVFDQPLELPLLGALWLEEATKEELLARWIRMVRERRLAILEKTRVVGVEPEDGRFSVATAEAGGRPEALTARRVLLAVGRRGSPRRLPVDVPEAMASRVHYSLADARSFAEQRVLVVGLGDQAMEAAIALSRQAGTRVTVAYRGEGFRRGKRRNIEALRRRVASGAVRLELRTEIAALEEGRALLAGPDGRRGLECDAIFVFIGSIPPREFLARAGVALGPARQEEKESSS